MREIEIVFLLHHVVGKFIAECKTDPPRIARIVDNVQSSDFRLLSAVFGLAAGWLCVRLSGVYLAMLSLAVAQIAWATSFQWVELTGGDNGILGVWPEPAVASKPAYFLLTLALAALALAALRIIAFSPFGYALRAARDAEKRAEASGIPAQRLRIAAFVIAAAFAGLAGGLYAFAKGSVFPTYLAIGKSVDALIMVLLGGISSLTGPIVGAFAFGGLQAELMARLPYWRATLGVVILILVLVAPNGLMGLWTRVGKRREASAA